jgi:cobyrinic acid a,c-diamide synthase
MSAPVLVIAGVASGVGKTTVTLGLLEAYRRRGLAVQAFKVGPDFIDPGFHESATGRASYNLDGWMCGRTAVLHTVAQQSAGADLAVVEGMMGCFDGADATGDEGSTAEIARWLEAPVILVLDAAAQARSAAAVVLGFERFDPKLHLAGVVANRVGSETHGRWVGDAMATACRAPLLGAIPLDAEVQVPERHLGLVTAREGVWPQERRARLAALVERSVDLDRLLGIARGAAAHRGPRRSAALGPRGDLAPHRDEPAAPPAATPGRVPPRARVGVARDAAFQFYYAENLDQLRAAGAEVVFWSPLESDALPDVDGLYFGGGYPELHARRLAENVALHEGIGRFAAAGRPIYAECGGLMYLARALEDADGMLHPMVGVLPATVRMRPRGLTLAYTEIETMRDSVLGPAGSRARGHEFHASTLDPVPGSIERLYRLRRRDGGERREGYVVGSVLVSYVHLHFASSPGLAAAFVAACAR